LRSPPRRPEAFRFWPAAANGFELVTFSTILCWERGQRLRESYQLPGFDLATSSMQTVGPENFDVDLDSGANPRRSILATRISWLWNPSKELEALAGCGKTSISTASANTIRLSSLRMVACYRGILCRIIELRQ
jgi:hypothetical protein